MIFGTVKTAMDFVNQSKATFYLTGSRFFGNPNQNSDWDFFVDEKEINQEELKIQGFKLESCPNYMGDPLLTQVYKKDNVHIQIVNNAQLKLHIQTEIKPLMQALNPSKSMAKLIWQTAFNLAVPAAIRRETTSFNDDLSRLNVGMRVSPEMPF